MKNGSAVATRLPSASGEGLFGHWFWRPVTGAALEWSTTPAWGLLLLATPFLLALGGLVSAAMGKDAYKYFTGEDGLVENMQVVLYAAALVMSFLVARRLRAADEKGIAAMYLLLGVGFFFLVGEEVSWGQRVFGWITPETLREIKGRVSKTLVAIGGITLDRARLAIEAGADSVAVISDLYSTGDMTGRTSEFLQRLG